MLTISVATLGRFLYWVSASVSSANNQQALAQPLPQAGSERRITLTANVQEENPVTGDVRAIGNVVSGDLDAEIAAKADEVQFIKSQQQSILLGNVQLTQREESVQGKKFICSIPERQCRMIEP